MMELASVVRSKNSGPFELTLDIMFDNEDSYRRVKKADVLGNEIIKKLYQVQDDDILERIKYRVDRHLERRASIAQAAQRLDHGRVVN